MKILETKQIRDVFFFTPEQKKNYGELSKSTLKNLHV